MGRNHKEETVEKTLIANYEKYYRLAYSYVRNEADAMDIVQEAAYKAILHSDGLKNISYADTWIYRIVINEACSLLRKQKETALLTDVSAICEDSYEDVDLRQAIERLNPRDRTIVTLRFFEEKRLEEIAEITGENLSTVKSRLYRVVSKLRLALSE